jgi:hypothetical protein
MFKKTLQLSIILLLSGCFAVAQTAGQRVTIKIENKSNVEYSGKVISIPWEKIKGICKSVDTANLMITDAVSKAEIVFQYEFLGNQEIQNLLVQVNLKPNSPVSIVLQKGKHAPFVAKTYGRFVPERKEDFAWENDKIAFRMYGKELEKTPKENAFGIDVWVKRTDKLIINERYKRGEYHVDHGDGMDYYHVGLTLGAGNLMPYINDSIWYSKNYTSHKVLDNGPLRTTFQLGYEPWEINGKQVSAIKTISLDAGSQLSKVSVEYKYEGEKLPVVAGIIKRPEPGAALLNEKDGILGYWEPEHSKYGATGVGCIIPSPVLKMETRRNQLVAYSVSEANTPFVYYTGAAWNKAGVITNESQWFAYLVQFQKQLAAESNINVSFPAGK